MAETKKRRFLRGLLIYTGILLLLFGVALLIFSRWLTVYEATRPETAMAAYRDALRSEGPDAACMEALTELDRELRSEAENRALLAALLAGADYREDISASGEEEKVYRILAEGRELGRVTLRRSGPARFGMRGWAVAEENYALSAFFDSVSVTVPPDYRVYLGDTLLDGSYVSDRAVPYEHLAQCYGVLDELPLLCRYESGSYLGEEPLRVLDARGRELSAEQLNELYYLDNCDEQTKARLSAFVEDYVRRYIDFTANIEQSYESAFSYLAWLVVPGSSLSTRMRMALTDGWWSNAISCTLQELDIRLITDLGPNGWLVELGYETRTSTNYDTVSDRYDVRLLVTEYNGSLRAYAMYFIE